VCRFRCVDGGGEYCCEVRLELILGEVVVELDVDDEEDMVDVLLLAGDDGIGVAL